LRITLLKYQITRKPCCRKETARCHTGALRNRFNVSSRSTWW